jgi:putative ABC transport system permease protein
LLRILPFDFRSEFGDEMEEAFREQRARTVDGGNLSLFRMWWITITDIVRMAPREHANVLAQDTRFALRMMGKNLGFTIAAIAILGLGIGANTSIFSVVHSVLLRALPYADGDQIVTLRQTRAKNGAPMSLSVAEINDYRTRSRTLESIVEYHAMTFTLFGGGEPHSVRTGVVSAAFFDFLGVKPVLGRIFEPTDEGPGAPPVLVLSYEFWKRQERGDPTIIGKRYEMNDRVHIVIGVLPPIPQYPSENDVYMPTSACPARSSARFIANRNARMMMAFGRMKPGVTLDQARVDLRSVAAQLEKEYPASYPAALGYSMAPEQLRTELTRRAGPLLWALLGAAGFVLLIACANVANLILARMAQRERELTIRWAMGAGAGRLLRQLLTESLILALMAAGVGLAFAWGSIELLTGFAAQLTPRAREISLDRWVLAFAVICASGTSVICGSLAALHSRNGAARAPVAQHNRLRSVLIVAQVAFSCILLIGAGLMARSLGNLMRVDPGFTAQRTFAVNFDLDSSKFPMGSNRERIADRRLLDGIHQLPAILSAAVSSDFPMNPGPRMSMLGEHFRPYGDTRPEGELPAAGILRYVSPDYFRTLGIPILSGRGIQESDDEKAPNVVVINRSIATKVWGKGDPVGKKIAFDGSMWFEIVGVVGDVKEFGPGQETPSQMYFSIDRMPMATCLVVRAAGEPNSVIGSVRRVVLESNPGTAVTRIETLDDARSEAVRPPRTVARLFGVFAALALVIAVAGIASMLMLWVRQGMREIGIRMALGARPADIVGGVLQQGMIRAVVGLTLGLGGAVALTRAIKTLLFEVTPTDVGTYAGVSLVLLAATLLASWLPARRAARIDPQAALRCE